MSFLDKYYAICFIKKFKMDTEKVFSSIELLSTKLPLTLLSLVLCDFSKNIKFYAAVCFQRPKKVRVDTIVIAQNTSRKTDFPKKTI